MCISCLRTAGQLTEAVSIELSQREGQLSGCLCLVGSTRALQMLVWFLLVLLGGTVVGVLYLGALSAKLWLRRKRTEVRATVSLCRAHCVTGRPQTFLRYFSILYTNMRDSVSSLRLRRCPVPATGRPTTSPQDGLRSVRTVSPSSTNATLVHANESATHRCDCWSGTDSAEGMKRWRQAAWTMQLLVPLAFIDFASSLSVTPWLLSVAADGSAKTFATLGPTLIYEYFSPTTNISFSATLDRHTPRTLPSILTQGMHGAMRPSEGMVFRSSPVIGRHQRSWESLLRYAEVFFPAGARCSPALCLDPRKFCFFRGHVSRDEGTFFPDLSLSRCSSSLSSLLRLPSSAPPAHLAHIAPRLGSLSGPRVLHGKRLQRSRHEIPPYVCPPRLRAVPAAFLSSLWQRVSPTQRSTQRQALAETQEEDAQEGVESDEGAELNDSGDEQGWSFSAASSEAFHSPVMSFLFRQWRTTPPVTKTYLSLAAVLSVLASFSSSSSCVSPSGLVFDAGAVRSGRELYRIPSSLFFLGPLSIPSLLSFSFIHAYLGGLETHFQRAHSRETLGKMLAFGVACTYTLAGLRQIPDDHVIQTLCTFLLYVWSQMFPAGETDVYGLCTIPNAFLPFFFLAQNWLLEGKVVTADLWGVGIAMLWLLSQRMRCCSLYQDSAPTGKGSSASSSPSKDRKNCGDSSKSVKTSRPVRDKGAAIPLEY
ncbi:derlin [Cystoisospora suis]|uniref:Derlin n=1 Tax=Cystoisospora suis TaxID=483139 RepID=A0A2C6KQX3_9APIC|nr:derlin [Cystoisospora suis]